MTRAIMREEQGFEEARAEAERRGIALWRLPSGGYVAASYGEAEELPGDSVEQE